MACCGWSGIDLLLLFFFPFGGGTAALSLIGMRSVVCQVERRRICFGVW